jgi:hypothetical protein
MTAMMIYPALSKNLQTPFTCTDVAHFTSTFKGVSRGAKAYHRLPSI